MGVDLGERRIGVAVSDGSGTLATPHATIERHGDRSADHAAIAAVVEETGAGRVVVGLPLSLDGRAGRAARAVQAEVDQLAGVLAPLGVTVETIDERLSTVSAQRALHEAGHRSRAQRHIVDRSAAAVILQAWLDRGGAGRG